MERDEHSVRQRLVLCLDGTWNQQDSGTNVYHLANLIKEGEVAAPDGTWRQRVEYQPGVGTGVLDSITGGGFGIGLSRNVREAYDWLVEQYREGDEIYVFGFSRGAFTARSLVGLISKCGLVRRGAPIPPEELWHAYQILGRHRNARTGMEPAANWWERLAGKRKAPFRELQVLRRETWEKIDPRFKIKDPVNRAERLLVEWSRRVPIHCVGVFDTVGALGLNALAIPWLRDHTAQFHDARLTTLVLNGFQALAVDEHRTSFAPIPWYRETDAGIPQNETANGGRIEQRWFTGAHSNVGGGYEDDILAQFSLAWMIEEVSRLGLVFRSVGKDDPNPAASPIPEQCLPLLSSQKSSEDLADQAAAVRDSFGEFAGGIWQHFIRSKRKYRRIAPPPELQNGKEVQILNETLDPSVRALAKAESAYPPPNLWRYLKDQNPSSFSAPPPKHRYGDARGSWWLKLAVWLALIAITGDALGAKIDDWLGSPGGDWTWRWLAALAPLLAFLFDWRESVLNHKTALDPEGPKAEKRRAWMDLYLAFRLCAILAAATGTVLVGYFLFFTGVRQDLPIQAPLGWLLALIVLWMAFQGGLSWCNGPMTDAGLGSVVKLQFTRSPQAVREILGEWAQGTKDRQLLMPAVRALWRDMLVLIPINTAVLFLGSWLALSLPQSHFWGHAPYAGLLLSRESLWIPALALAILCALSDYAEDLGELRYIARFPKEPSRLAVLLTFFATLAKTLLFSIGFLLTAGATVALAFLPFRDLFEKCEMHTIGLIAAIYALTLIWAQIKSLHAARKVEDSTT